MTILLSHRRWYQLGLKQPKTISEGTKKKEKKKSSNGTNSAGAMDEDEEPDSDDDNEDDEAEKITDYDDGTYFGFIDEHGNVNIVSLSFSLKCCDFFAYRLFMLIWKQKKLTIKQ